MILSAVDKLLHLVLIMALKVIVDFVRLHSKHSTFCCNKAVYYISDLKLLEELHIALTYPTIKTEISEMAQNFQKWPQKTNFVGSSSKFQEMLC